MVTTSAPVGESAKPSDGAPPYLILYGFDPPRKKHSFSSFVTKLQFRLRHSGIPYVDGWGNRNEAPKTKVPYVKFLDSGEIMGDSSLIIRRLIDAGKLVDVNANLSPAERARDYCLRAMIEEKLMFFLIYERWSENFQSLKDDGPFTHLHWMIRPIVASLAWQYSRVMLWGQGTGRHKPEEVKQLQEEAMEALANYATAALEKAAGSDPKEPFWILGGKTPTEADFTVFGFLAGVLCGPNQPRMTSLIMQSKSLMSYIRRIHDTYFTDYADLVL